ncbi:MAG: hypothetical protein WD690_12860 [Vicinamibacterales bacterium]
MKTLPMLSLLCLFAGITVEAQQGRPERGTDLTPIDIAVVMPNGQPVVDLRADEISVRLAGRSRRVRSLQMVTAPLSNAGRAVPPPFGSNARSDEGRSVALVIDDDSFRPGREAAIREAVDALLDGLSPRDRLALVTVPYGGLKVPLTTEHERVRTALGTVVGRALEGETGSDLACRTRRTLESLAGYLTSLGFRESPAIVVFVTAGLASPRRDAPVTMAPGMCELTSDTFQQVAVAGAAARAQFYVVQPADIMTAGTIARETIAGAEYGGSDNPVEGLEHLAGVTGGKILQLTGSPGGALGRVLQETSVHYIVGVEPGPQDRTGKSLPLDVRVSRPGVEVRARPQIAFPKPDWAATRPANPSPREMLSVPTVFRDLPLRASAFSSLDADGKTLRVTTLAEPIEPGTKLTSLVAALFDRDGKLVANWVAAEPELARAPVIGAMNVEPGAYRLRVAAIDATGRSGTADYDLEAELVQTGPLKLSSVVLGLSREGNFVPRLEFSTEPVAIGYVELYGGTPGMRVSATLEIAREQNGPALISVPLAISPAGEGRYVAKGAVPIGALPPGDYAVRALVGIEGQPATRVTRTLRKR